MTDFFEKVKFGSSLDVKTWCKLEVWIKFACEHLVQTLGGQGPVFIPAPPEVVVSRVFINTKF